MSPDPARLQPGAPLNVVFDGNSLVQGIGASSGEHSATGTTLPGQVATLLGRRFTSLTVVNKGISAQSWADMVQPGGAGIGDGPGDVDGAYVVGRTNVLVLWETTNSVFNLNRSAAETIALAQSYIAGRLALHPGWRILNVSTLPREKLGDGTQGAGQTTIDDRNQRLLQVDGAIRNGIRAWGGRGQIDLRGAGSPFNLPDFSPASFARNDALWREAPYASGSGDLFGRVHLTDAGYAVVAGLVARAIGNLAAR